MTRNQDRDVLREQLQEALAEVATGQVCGGGPEAFEVAVLAGLLSRHAARGDADPAEVALLAAAEPVARAAADLALEEIADEQAERVCALEEDDAAAERTCALLDLDELCAGAWFSGRAAAVAGAADLTARSIAAFPEPWRDLSGLAAGVLEQCPPRPGDPARALWRTLLAVRWRDEREPRAPPCLEARARLGVAPRVGLSSLRAPVPCTSGALPPPPELRPILAGADFELALGLDPDSGAQVLVLRAPATAAPRLWRDDGPAALSALEPGLWSGPAEPGIYRLSGLGGDEPVFEVEASA